MLQGQCQRGEASRDAPRRRRGAVTAHARTAPRARGVPAQMSEPLLRPRVLCALDFGTTFSGFAFCSLSDDSKIFQWCAALAAPATCAMSAAADKACLAFHRHDWPDQLAAGGLPYCKTRTELLLDGDGDVLAWGWSALLQHLNAAAATAPAGEEEEDTNEPPAPVLLSQFKLRLAPGAGSGDDAAAPHGVGVHGVRRLVAQYLGRLGGLAIEHIRKQLGQHIRAADIQWCLTVRGARVC